MPAALHDPASAEKLARANTLIDFSFQSILLAAAQGLSWFVFNPRRSYLWAYPQWKQLSWCDVDLDSCEFGGSRKIPQRIRCSSSTLAHLGRSCSGGHAHKFSPTVFKDGRVEKQGASREDIMPELLSSEIAKAIRQSFPSEQTAPSSGEAMAAFSFAAASRPIDPNKHRVALLAASAGLQSRGRRLKALIPEYKRTREVSLPAVESERFHKRQRLKEGTMFGGCKLRTESQIISLIEGFSVGLDSCVANLGEAWSPEEFLSRAKRCEHPFAAVHLPDEISRAVFSSLTLGPAGVRDRQLDFRRKWESRGAELADEEAAFCRELHPSVAEFALKKRPLLLAEILKDLQFPAADLVVELVSKGCPMFGAFPSSGVFPKREHEASLQRGHLLAAAKWAKPALLNSRKGIAITEDQKAVQQKLWDATIEERDNRECRGPFSVTDLDARHPAGWLAAERFAVEQKGKVRPCDNYSEFGHNATSSSTETVDTDGPDSIVSVGRMWSSSVRKNGKVHVRLSDGSAIEGTLHSSLTPEMVDILMARLIDLKRAYKQLASNPDDAAFAIFGLRNPQGEWVFFEASVLGFGSRNAVLGFNLVARALRFIANKGLLIPVTHFFDDFSHVEPSEFSAGNCDALEWMFNLLGWSYKDGPDDLKAAAPCFAPLGVRISFEVPGWVEVANTQKRLDKIQEEVKRLVSLPRIPTHDVESIVGVCQFTEAQTSGRSGALALRQVRRALSSYDRKDVARLHASLKELAAHSAAATPRWLKLRYVEKPVLIFTDAAADPGLVTVGGVLYDPEDGRFEFFGAVLTEETIAPWIAEGKEQVICQAELLAVPLAFVTWEDVIRGREVISFIDNDPARDALVHGISGSASSSEMVRFTRLFCARNAMGAWYERVPSPSNIADDPSRGRFDRLLNSGARRVAPILPALGNAISLRQFAVA